MTPKGHMRDMHQYFRAGWRNWSQSFGKWQIWLWTTHWIHFGFLISITGVRNVLQTQEGVPTFFQRILSHFSMSLGVRGGSVIFLFLFLDYFVKRLTAKCYIFKFFVYIFWFCRGFRIGAKTQNRGKAPPPDMPPARPTPEILVIN